jgi:hypothetical protein
MLIAIQCSLVITQSAAVGKKGKMDESDEGIAGLQKK